jgi:carnitine-CoA ligase
MSIVDGLSSRWREAVVAVPHRPFLVFEDMHERVHTWTYEEWDRVVARAAGHLRAHGLGPGDRLHIVLANSPGFVACWLACLRLGAILVPSDPRSTEPELAAHREIVDPAVTVRETCAATEDGALAVAIDDVLLESWSEGTPVVDEASGDPLRVAAILFTSGTTSKPKGVEITDANYGFAAEVMAAAAGITTTDRLLVVLPLFHANAQYYSFAPAIARGACVCLMNRFSASGFIAQAGRHAATHASLFAAPMRMILARHAGDFAVTMRHCWYAQGLGEEQLAKFARLIGCHPRQLYGMTETIAAVTTQRPLEAGGPGIGLATPGCDVDLRNPGSIEPVPTGAIGEITVGGVPGISLFRGYWKQPEATRASFVDGRFRTGDLAVADQRGRLRFHGRRDDLLKVAGENVSTIEVEAALDAHAAVHEVAVVGRPDPLRDEVPVAYVVLRSDAQGATVEELLEFARGRLSPSKQPRDVIFVDELPRTSVGKVRKFLLNERAGRRVSQTRVSETE